MTAESQQLAVALARLEAVFGDIADIKATLRELTAAVSRLAVIEERQQAAGAAQERAFGAIAELKARVAVLEQAQPIQKQSSDLVQKVVGWIVAAVISAGLTGLTLSTVKADPLPPVTVDRRQ